MSKANTAAARGGKVKKPPPVEKPAMFAFCLKPRGLEVPNKGSKHRSQKKIHIAHAIIGDQDSGHTFGNKSYICLPSVFFSWSRYSILVLWLIFPHLFLHLQEEDQIHSHFEMRKLRILTIVLKIQILPLQ